MRIRIALACLAALMDLSWGLTTAAQARPAHASPATSYVSFQPQVRGLGCLQPRTRAMVARLTARVGPIEITSTCGGRHAHNSQHYRGAAIDFRPRTASVGRTLAVLRGMPEVGGIGSYAGGLIHADTGPRRFAWHGSARHRVARAHRSYARYAARRGAHRSGSV